MIGIIAGLSLLIPQVWGMDLKRADDLRDFDGSFSITEKQVRYNIPYHISNGIINDMTLYCEDGSLLIQITAQNESDVKLTLDLPRSVLNPKINDKDDQFFVLRDGQEIEYGEIPYAKHREISMSFSSDTEEIEIIHSFISELKPEMCEIVHDPPYSYVLSPLKQIKSGIAIDEIQCKESMTLMTKNEKRPACVTMSTASKLSDRGWLWMLDVIEWDSNSKHLEIDNDNFPHVGEFIENQIWPSPFQEIINDIEKLEYGICGIEVKQNKIVIHLNWIFEDTKQEQEIISKIPNDIDYQIIYYDDYVNFSPQTLREPHCEILKRDPNQDGQTVSFSFCGIEGFDSQGNSNKSNSTHNWDENYCEWRVLENEN